MATLFQDLRYAVRMLAKSPGFTAIAILTLALGIGANTAIFSVINATLLRPLPYADADRLVLVWQTYGTGANNINIVSAPNIHDIEKESDVFESMAMFDSARRGYNLAEGNEPERISGVRVTSKFFHVLGIKPLLGRTFLPEEETADKDHEVVLSYGLWKRRFAGDPALIGKPIRIDGQSYTVVGLMPQEFEFQVAERLWPGKNPIGQMCIADWRGEHKAEVIGLVGDIRTVATDKSPVLMVYVPGWFIGESYPGGASIVVRTSMDASGAASAVRDAIRKVDSGVPITALRPMTQVVSKSVDTRRFQMLLALLFAACALFLASLGIFGVVAYSVEQRRHELGIRLALGAQLGNLRAMILRQGMVPVVAGLGAGVAASLFIGRLIAGLFFGVHAFDPLTFSCVALVVVIVALAACYIPARRAMRVDPMVALRYE